MVSKIFQIISDDLTYNAIKKLLKASLLRRDSQISTRPQFPNVQWNRSKKHVKQPEEEPVSYIRKLFSPNNIITRLLMENMHFI